MAARALNSDPEQHHPGAPLERNAAEALARTLRAVADPTRLQLLSMIAGAPDEEVTVGDLAASLGLSQPTVTHHLRILVDDGVVVRQQRGKYVWHAIAPDRRAAIIDLLR
ncbi:hypothetical protein BH10ACT7_BH10ACT7_23670 [soil metagenome]